MRSTQAAGETPPPKPKRVFRKPVEARLHLGLNIIATFPRVSHLIFALNPVLYCIYVAHHREAVMAPRVPSDKVLESALEDAVQSIFDSAERGQLTVNYVRQVAEKNLGLEDGFFKTGDWKARSKEVARKAVVSAGWSSSSHAVANLPPR
jgi:hypothetical protein